MSDATSQIPDLLRRFVPTPFSAKAVLHHTKVLLTTNDGNLLALASRLGTGTAQDAAGAVLLTIVRDDDAPDGDSEPVIISDGLVKVMFVGAGTMLLVDGEHNEVFGFLAHSVSADRFLGELLPIALKLLPNERVRSDSQ
jgi:tetrahydromethanopterin S-methyltransferase subunit D